MNNQSKDEYLDELAEIACKKADNIIEGKSFQCHDCNKVKPINKDGGTGYGLLILPDQIEKVKICYDCCAIRDKKEMEETGKFVGYISKDKDNKWHFSNWPGSLKIPAYVEKSNHNWWHVQKMNVWFHYGGYRWFGTNIGSNDICRAKRTKTKS